MGGQNLPNSAHPGWNRVKEVAWVKVSENLGATVVVSFAPVDTSLQFIP